MMGNTLVSQSGVFYLKSKFFIIRVLTYFSFLLIPIGIPKTLYVSSGIQALMIALYMLFICSQWFFLGKEIDHRLKIYFRVNSSMDRVIYRLFLGLFSFIIIFNILSLFPSKWIYNCFWGIWIALGLFYSWPTRGKIIKESVSTNFTEFRYLDAFEKTLVFLTLILFTLSVPDLPVVVDKEALKLFFDPGENISSLYWNFVVVNYYPFYRYSELFKIAVSLHFYIINLGLFLLCFYGFLRFFLSRRLSLLGLFAIISSWSWTKILVANYGSSLDSTYSMLWVWTLLWVTKSSTYRTGLFLGLVGWYGCLINQSWIFLLIPQFALLHCFLTDKTFWFKKQIFRYSSFGIILSFSLMMYHDRAFVGLFSLDNTFFTEMEIIWSRKAFFSLAPLGLLLVGFLFLNERSKLVSSFKIDKGYLLNALKTIPVLFVFSLFSESNLLGGFSLMWLFTFFGLFPLELIFQTMSRLRSSRNMIYLIYILICLLDSHFEGRVKIFFRTFEFIF